MYKIYIDEEKRNKLVQLIDECWSKTSIPQNYKKTVIDYYQIKSGVPTTSIFRTSITFECRCRWEYKKIKSGNKKKKKLIECDLCKLFRKTITNRYLKFRSDYTKRWLEILEINTCIYCNLSFTNSNNKAEVSIDHFFHKNKYPLLTCNIFNFIPTCAVCNSQYKHTEDFSTDSYPYEFDDVSKHLQDNCIVKQDISCYSDIAAVYINGKENLNLGVKTANNNNKFIKILELEKRYNHPAIRNEALELLYKIEAVNNVARVSSFTKLFSSIGLTEEKTKQIFFGTTLSDKSDYIKRPLSKLCRDLIKQHAPWMLEG